MKTHILYQTKHGTTEKLARMLANMLEGDVDIYKIDQTNFNQMINADRIIIGGSIHAGKIQRGVKRFCEQFEKELQNKETGLFISCILKEQEQQQFLEAFPSDLIQNSKAQGVFGGEIVLEKMNFIDRLLTKYLAKINRNVSYLYYPAIDQFVEEMEC